MPKAVNKTVATKASVKAFLDAIENETRRKDAKAIDKLMRDVSGEKPAMWGPSIVGYGVHHYKYDSGREGSICKLGFAPRKGNFALYGLLDVKGHEALLKKLGKHKAGKGCLYISKLADIDQGVLRQLMARGWSAKAK